MPMARDSTKFLTHTDLILGSVAAFYVLAVPCTKVQENFNMQVLMVQSSMEIEYKRNNEGFGFHKWGSSAITCLLTHSVLVEYLTKLDRGPARRQVRSTFIDFHQHLDHVLFKMAPPRIRTEETQSISSHIPLT